MISQISIIGSGNLAWHLAPALENVGYKVNDVYSRNREHAAKLVGRLYNAEVKDNLDYSESTSDLIIIAIKDDAIEDICTELIIKEQCGVVHTSGTQPISVLGYVPTEHTGVIYPLQTFSKSKSVSFEEIPICVEAMTSTLEEDLKILSGKISKKVVKMDSHDRRLLHLAAVFACNFTNQLFHISKELLDRRGIEFDLLHPLIRETVEKSLNLGPENAQTGPAARQDYEVIDTHLSYLSQEEELSSLYELITKLIIQQTSRE